MLDKKAYATSFCGEYSQHAYNRKFLSFLKSVISNPTGPPGTPPYMAPELFLSYLSKSSQGGVVG